MKLFLAHDPKYHTQNTSGFMHFITQPLTLSVLFLVGLVVVGWGIRNYVWLSPLQRALGLLAYFALAVVVGFTYAPSTAAIAFTLAIMTILSYVMVLLCFEPTTKNPTKRKR